MEVRLILSTAGAAAVAALALTGPAWAGRAAAHPHSSGHRPVRVRNGLSRDGMRLRAMPEGFVTFGRDSGGRLTVRAGLRGLTPGSAHAVDLLIPGRPGYVRFSPLTAASTGAAHMVLLSNFTGALPRGSRLVVRMGAGDSGPARLKIGETAPIAGGPGPYRVISAEAGSNGVHWGTPQGYAAVSWNPSRRTLTVSVTASGLTPGPHAAHIHLGSCAMQGPVKYALPDLMANAQGRVPPTVQVFTDVNAPIPVRGWYLNIHQGSSANIVNGNGQPAIFFRPLLCSNVGM